MEYAVSLTQTNNGLIDNADEILKLVKSNEYKKYNYVVDAGNYKTAKTDKQKLSDEIEKAKRERIDFEKRLQDQWTPVKSKLMEAEKIVESYVKSLKEGMDIVDEEAKNQKKEIIRQYFEGLENELAIPFEVIFETSYLNKSCSEKKWKERITNKMNDLEYDYYSLTRMNVDDIELLQSLYTQTWSRYEAEVEYDKQMAARARAEEIKQKKEKAIPAMPISQTIKNDPPVKVTKMLTIRGTNTQVNDAIDYLRNVGLQVEVI